MNKRVWKEVKLENSDNVWDRKDPIEGRFIKVDTDVGPNKSNMYFLENDKGQEVKIWGSTVLDDKLIGVPKGSYVKIVYEGKLTSKKGTQYHGYKVFFDEAVQPEAQDEADERVNLSELFED